MIWLWLILLVTGFVLLVWSADLFVEGTAALARNLGVSDLFIGLTAVSIGTSAPEIFIAITDSFKAEPDIAIGNAIGSNVANMGLVLGITALVVPLPYDQRILRSELPLLLLATVLAGICLVDLSLGRIDGILFLTMFGFIMYRMVRSSTQTEQLPDELEHALSDIPKIGTSRASLQAIIGLAVLVVSANFLIVDPARSLADALEVPVFDVGTTLVAVGTSLPELVVTLRAAIKGGYGIAIGNIVGSNMLNLLVVLSVPALMHPAKLSAMEFLLDFGMMFILTVTIALFADAVGAKKVITRLEGALLLAAWIGYIALKYT